QHRRGRLRQRLRGGSYHFHELSDDGGGLPDDEPWGRLPRLRNEVEFHRVARVFHLPRRQQQRSWVRRRGRRFGQRLRDRGHQLLELPDDGGGFPEGPRGRDQRLRDEVQSRWHRPHL